MPIINASSVAVLQWQQAKLRREQLERLALLEEIQALTGEGKSVDIPPAPV